MKTYSHACNRCPSGIALIGIAVMVLAASARAQLSPALASQIKQLSSDRVEAAVILGGDYGGADGHYTENTSQRETTLDLSKFGGGGDVGDPHQLGDLPIGWQPRIQGGLGYLSAKNHFVSGPFYGDNSQLDTFAIQFGGGARFWLWDYLSIAPTIMGMYGHSKDSYSANSATATANQASAQNMGLIRWNTDTWSIVPAGNLQYAYNWRRIIFTYSTDFTYYHTESFDSSNSGLSINGDSETWRNKLDVDIPLSKNLFGHELRTGGFVSRTEFYDSIKTGLNSSFLYEVHGRIVMDFLGELWKVQWLGLGASYLWGNNFKGYTFGVDAAFRF